MKELWIKEENEGGIACQREVFFSFVFSFAFYRTCLSSLHFFSPLSLSYPCDTRRRALRLERASENCSWNNNAEQLHFHSSKISYFLSRQSSRSASRCEASNRVDRAHSTRRAARTFAFASPNARDPANSSRFSARTKSTAPNASVWMNTASKSLARASKEAKRKSTARQARRNVQPQAAECFAHRALLVI